MKTCKKILAGILVFAMMMSVCAFVSADETEATPVTDKLLIVNDFDELTVGDVLKNSGYFNSRTDTGAITEKIFYAKNAAPSNKLTATVMGDDTNKYLATTHNRLGYNQYWKDTHFTGFGYSDELSVFSTSYDIMIPADDAYKTYRRYAYVNIGAYETGTYDATITSPHVSIVNGKITATSGSCTASYSKELDYTYGEWVTIKIDAWINTNNKPSIAVYANDRLIYAADYIGTRTAVGICSRFFELMYANVEGGNTVESVASTDGTVVSTTNYDNISMSLLTADNELTAEDIDARKALDAEEERLKAEAEAAAKAATPYIRLTGWTGDKLGDKVGIRGEAVLPGEGVMKYDFVQAGDTDEHTAEAYELVTADDRTYVNVTSSSYKYLLANFRASFDDYVQKQSDITNIFVYSADLKLQDLSAPITNAFCLGMDLSSEDTVDPTNPEGDKIAGRKTNDLAFYYKIDAEGNIRFGDTVVSYGSAIDGYGRSESRTVPTGEWINVKFVMEIVHGEEAYEIMVYGIYNDAVIHENKYTLRYMDYDRDGVKDDIHVGQSYITIGADNKTHTETVVGIDNICFEKNNNFSWDGINTDAWLDRNVTLVLDADGNVDVEARKGEGAFGRGILVVALYDANGKIVEIIKSTDITDGKFVYEVPAAKVATAKKIKGFVLDGITTAVPQFKHGSIVIE